MKGIMGSSKGDLRKTRSFVVQKNQINSSMQQVLLKKAEDGNNSNIEKNKNKRGSLVEFPVSPQLMYGEEMIHFSHPRHRLSRICIPDLYTCSGCKEYGAGNRFSCQECDFQLHDFCALSPPVLKSHPFHSHHQLLFYSKLRTTAAHSNKCDICAKPIKGFGFRCGVCNSFQMHPCCAMLSTELNLPSVHSSAHGHLRMVAGSSSSSSSSVECGECGKRKRSGRVYRCRMCEYEVHAVCVKNAKNGLRDNGHKGNDHEHKSGGSMLGTVGRLASQVVVEFLGGIIEGIGEGVGEAFVQNINPKAAPLHRPLPPPPHPRPHPY